MRGLRPGLPSALILSAWPALLAGGGGEQALTVPQGFEVTLAAGHPLVDRPISADLDEQGRLYVTDSSGSNEKVEKQLAEKPHRVVRLEDTDRDGRFDRSVVFADRMMFPEGAMWLDGSLYVAAPPSIWKLTDADGDGVAERREEWFQGKTLTGCANDLHGPYLGLEGWIYWTKGAFARQSYERPGKPPFVTRAAHIFRSRPDGSGIEAVMTGGMDNPVEVAFTPEGERLFTSTFLQQPEAGRRDGIIHAIYGGVYGKVNDVVDEHKRTGDLMPVLTHLGPAVPSGLACYRSRAFGEEYRGNLFATLFNLHKVTRHALEPEGATYRSRDSDFLVSQSTDFHPTDVLEDADGSLLVIDTGGWYKLCCPTSQLPKPDVLGAIYRVRRASAPGDADPRGLEIGWGALGPSGIVPLLGDARPAVGRRAVEEIAKRGEAALPALRGVLQGSPASISAEAGSAKAASAEARRNAVWALARIAGPEARAAARAALRDRDESVRHAAAHSAGVWRDEGALPSLLEALRSPSAHLRRVAAEALGRIGSKSAVPALLEATLEATASPTPSSTDRVLEHSLIYALIEIADPAGVRAALESPNPRARRAALIALDQMDGGGLEPEAITPLLASRERILAETASWIAGRHPAWGGALAGFLRERLAAKDQDPASLAELEGRLARFARDRAVQDLLVETLRDAGTAPQMRAVALRAMARAGLKEMPPAWAAEVARFISGSDAGLAREALAALRALPPGKEDAARLAAALLEVARDPAAPPERRLGALAAHAGPLPALEPELFEFLRESAGPDRPVAARDLAASALGRSKLGREQLLELARTLRSAGPLEAAKLLPAFDAASDEAVGLELVAALKESPSASGIPPDVLKERLKKFPDAVQREGAELLEALDADPAEQKARLDELAAALGGGDVRRGQAIFNSPRAACSSCHAIGYLGGRVGPDLTTIGQIRTERDLLESLVFPSASFVRSYETLVVVTRKGEIQSGVLKRDAPEELVLATGTTTEVRIPRSEIRDLRPGTVSIMPQGIDRQLSREELADLVAFLKATRWGPER